MDDVDRILRSSLREHAELTPAPVNLLGAVRERSRRQARRRHLAVGGGAAAAVLAVTAAAAMLPLWRGGQPTPPAGPGPVVPSVAASTNPSGVPSGPPATSPPAGQPTATGSGPTSHGTALRLGAPAYTLPAFPWRPGFTPIGGLDEPRVTLERGRIVAFYAARDPERGADVTVRIGPVRPAFGSAAGPVTESSMRARGRAATLRTVHVSPAAQLSLYWREATGRWVQVDTDDTLTGDEVVRFADELRAASLPVRAPFELDLAPVGMVPYTITPNTVAFRPASGPTDQVTCVLTEGAQRQTGRAVRVGGRRAGLTHTSSAAVLAVALDDRGETLTVTVPARYQVSDADLIRFAEGIGITRYAEVSP